MLTNHVYTCSMVMAAQCLSLAEKGWARSEIYSEGQIYSEKANVRGTWTGTVVNYVME